MTGSEYVYLLSTMERSYDNRWNCHWCIHEQNAGHQNKVKVTNIKRRSKGCWGKGPKYTIENIEYSSCIGNFYSAQAAHVVDLFMLFEKGVLPFDGCITNQPAKIFEAFDIIRSYRHQKELEANEERKNSKKR